MTTQNYLIIENNVVTNVVIWDGNTVDWQPPSDSIQLIQATTPAMIWEMTSPSTAYVLVEKVGFGGIEFTYDPATGIVTTNQPQPVILPA